MMAPFIGKETELSILKSLYEKNSASLLKSFITHILYALIFCTLLYTPSFAANNKHYSSTEAFVTDQKIIRVVLDYAGSFGNEAATLNVMNRLRQMGFKGTFEFIYPDNGTSKVTMLFNLPKDIPDVYEYQDKQNNKIVFIKISEYIRRLTHGLITPTTLGITGAYDSHHVVECAEFAECKRYADNFSDFTNTNVFVKLQPWYGYDNDDVLFIHNDPKYKPVIPQGKYVIVPTADLTETKEYLQSDPSAQELLKQKPALMTLINGLEKQNFNFLSAYGWTLQASREDGIYFPDNILQVLAGARYAQLNGPAELHKGLIVSVFYNYEDDETQLIQLINSNNWGKYEHPGAEQVRKVIKELGLSDPKVFSVASISDAKTINRIQSLQPGQILLLSMGQLPKIVFDGLFTHIGTNIWPQIREGQSSLNGLLIDGRPHFRCSQASIWEPGFSLVSEPSLKTRLENFYNKNDSGKGFCKIGAWEGDGNIYQTVGELIIEANNLNSPFSRYFQDIKSDAAKPENDRINRGLEEAIKIINSNTAF